MKKKRSRGKYAAKKTSITPLLWRIAVILLLVDVAAMGAVQMNRRQARQDYQRMAAAVQEVREENPVTEAPAATAAAQPSVLSHLTKATEPVSETEPAAATEGVTEPDDGILKQYRQFYKQNPEMVGWIQIEGTIIDYPVMHTPDDPEKYLQKDFWGEYSQSGVPFIDYRCTEDSDNLLIYGHNMSDDTMFHTLVEYRLKSYWLEHPVIRFDSLYEEREYEIMAAFYDRIYYEHETNFRFYNFIDAKNEADYNKAVKKFKEKSMYDTGVTPEYGQQLISLVTCTYREENGRFVVVACEKKKSQ